MPGVCGQWLRRISLRDSQQIKLNTGRGNLVVQRVPKQNLKLVRTITWKLCRASYSDFLLFFCKRIAFLPLLLSIDLQSAMPGPTDPPIKLAAATVLSLLKVRFLSAKGCNPSANGSAGRAVPRHGCLFNNFNKKSFAYVACLTPQVRLGRGDADNGWQRG